MSGFQFAWRKGNALPTPLCGEALLGESTQIHAGDVLVLTNATALNDVGAAGVLVVRPLFSGDTITTSNGIFGVALFDIQTDSEGNLITVSSAVSVDTRGKLDTSLMIANILPKDPASGFLRIPVGLFNSQNVWKGYGYSTEVISFYDVWRVAGIKASAATAPANYTVDVAAAAANAPLMVEGVDTDDPNYNSASGGAAIFVSGLPTFYQPQTGNYHTT